MGRYSCDVCRTRWTNLPQLGIVKLSPEELVMWLKKKHEEAPEELLAGIPFSPMEGKECSDALTLFALSTCGFCRRAIGYLNEQGIAYRFVYVDKLERSMQDAIRAYVKRRFRTMLSYPFLCIGERDYLTGFIRASWEKELCHE